MSQVELSTFVLAVADKPAMRGELTAALEGVPTVRITTAVSLGEALAELQAGEKRIDLVLLDVGLSAGGAVTLTRKLRDPLTFGSRHIPILTVGDSASPQIQQAIGRLGIQAHVPGILSSDRLRVAIRDALLAAPQKTKARPARKAAAEPPQPTPPYAAPASDAPPANKPFRHGLQARGPARKPLSEDDGFGFETPPLSIKPRRIFTADTFPDVAVFASRRRAVA